MTDGTDTRARLLGELLAECDEPCPACGYSLRGLAADRCPECGEKLCLAIRLARGPPVWYKAGKYGIAIAFLIHSLSLVWMMMVGGGMESLWVLPGAAISVLCGFVWAWSRPKVATARIPVRVMIAAVVTLMPAWTILFTSALFGGVTYFSRMMFW